MTEVARLNLDEESRTDYRISRVAKRTGEIRQATLGRMIDVWWLCYHRKTDVLPACDVDGAADMDGFAAAMVAAGLAEESPEIGEVSVRVKGAADRIEYLRTQSDKGRKGGLAKAERYAAEQNASTGQAAAKPGLSTGLAPASESWPSSSSSSSSSALPLLSSAPDLDPDLGADRSPPPAASKPVRAKKPKRVEIPIPDDWAPNDTALALARELGVDVQREERAFRDHALSKGRTLVDWHAGFRTWITKSAEYRQQRGGGAAARPAREEFKPL